MNADGTAHQIFTYGGVPAWAPVAPSLPVDQPPVARFTYYCSGLTCYFEPSGSTMTGHHRVHVDVRRWDQLYGSGHTHLRRRRNVHGDLTVTDGAGQSASTSQTVTVTPPPDMPPVASFGWSCAGLACTFNSAWSNDDVGIASRSWTFGDGSTAGNVVAPAKTFATPGMYA